MDDPQLQRQFEEHVLNFAGLIRLLRDERQRADDLLKAMQAHLAGVQDLDQRCQDRIAAVGTQVETALQAAIPQALHTHLTPLHTQVETSTGALTRSAKSLAQAASWMPTKLVLIIAASLMLTVGAVSLSWVASWKNQYDELAPSAALGVRLHGYLDATLYRHLNAKRQAEIDTIYQEVQLKPPTPQTPSPDTSTPPNAQP